MQPGGNSQAPDDWFEPYGNEPARSFDPVVAAVTIAITAVLLAAGLITAAHMLGEHSVPRAVAVVQPAVADIYSHLGYQGLVLAGTGIVISPSGDVVTNNHVISGATSIAVTDIGNHRTYQADVAGYDIADDIALLRLRGASGLKTAQLGDAAKVSVGDAVTAVGNAGGAGGSPSFATGTVTGLDQNIVALDETNGTTEHLTGLIATTAAIVSGESGGPLVDPSGRVVGVVTAGSSGFALESGPAEGFAIPIDRATTVTAQIWSGQSSSRVHVGPTAFLGVATMTSRFVAGAVVSSVYDNTPAAATNLQAGDVIVSLGGDPVRSAADLVTATLSHPPGDRVTLAWVDVLGRSQTATVKLIAGPPA